MNVVNGDLLSVTRGIIVHGCNCQGVMGAGLAWSIRNKWPSVYAAYRNRWHSCGLWLGDVVVVGSSKPRALGKPPEVCRHVHETTAELPEELYVVNAMTQDRYGREPGVVYADAVAIEAAFLRVALLARDTGLPVHFPQVGCGLAQGRWEDIEPRIGRALRGIEHTLWKLPER